MWIAKRIVSIITLCGLACLTWYSILLARADISFRDNNIEALRAAVQLAPGNAAYHALFAEHLESADENPDQQLELATDLSPHESRYWIRRGFRAELERKYAESERYLLRALEVDRGFDPRWALMNFYFRRGRLPEFWKSTREALDMSYGNRAPIFRLCLAANDDPSVTRQVLPPRREIHFAFFTYLIGHEFIDTAAGMAAELAAGAQPEEVPVFLDYCGRQMSHDVRSSLLVWNALCDRRLLPFTELAPEQGKIVTNGDFAVPPLQEGFDWRHSDSAGVAVGPLDSAQPLSITLNGSQSDHITLFEQTVPLAQGKTYSVNYEYQVAGDTGDTGLHWLVRGVQAGSTGGDDSPVVSPVFSARDWENGKIIFNAGQRQAARLVLEYQRLPATVKWNGTVRIRRVVSGLAQAGSPN
jgi:hypothetical protein